ncbi:hypothetical protein MMC28_010013 [Mycoblastus sanguinarius]|nr:hypothetical protein [Mycoblastus sanguinarius]
MAPSYVPPDLGELHEFVNHVANGTAGPISSIPRTVFGPLRPNSLFIGTHDAMGGAPLDEFVSVMLRCEWPLWAQPRHAVIKAKHSISEAQFGYAINHIFKVIDQGGVIEKMAVLWMNVFSLDLANGSPPLLHQNLSLLGDSKGGIFEIHVQPLELAGKCHSCGKMCTLTKSMLEGLRVSGFGTICFCKECNYSQSSKRTLFQDSYPRERN